MPELILLVGAPPAAVCTPEACTTSTFHDEFIHLLNLPKRSEAALSISVGSIKPQTVWRSLPLQPQILHTGFSPIHDAIMYDERCTGGCMSTTNLSFSGNIDSLQNNSQANEELLSDFCEQSLAIHTSLPSSQLVADETTTTLVTNTPSFMNTMLPATPENSAHLSDLEDIPSAKEILSYQPATVTLNLIVGILSIAQPRSVKTRWGQDLSLVEILVGDETKTSFSITFWIPTGTASQSEISALQRQDVVLFRNVGLHVFRDRVYGQSLRRGMTRMDVLWRRNGTAPYTTRNLRKALAQPEEQHPQTIKTKNVVDWVLHFVGPDVRTVTNPALQVWDMPPEDTQ